MPKTKLEKLRDNHIGSGGLKFEDKLSKKFNFATSVVDSIQIPASWSANYSTKLKTVVSLPDESDFKELIDNYCRQLRWWGESYSYFNRKSDSVIFSNELKFLIYQKIFIPTTNSWEVARSDHKPNPGWFIDPETNLAKQTETASRGLTVHPFTEFPEVNADSKISVPVSSYVSPGMINQIELNTLPKTTQIHALRVIVAALNIGLLMTSYPSQHAATETDQAKPILALIVPKNVQINSLVKFGIYLGSAELAYLFGQSRSDEFPLTGNQLAEVSAQLDTSQQLYTDYLQRLIKDTGIYNNVIINSSSQHPLIDLFGEDSVQQVPITPVTPEALVDEPELIESKVEQANLDLDSDIIRTSISEPKVEQSPIRIEQEPKPDKQVVERATPKPPMPTLPNSGDFVHSISHKFNYLGVTGLITVTLSDQSRPEQIAIMVTKQDPLMAAQLATISELGTSMLENGMSIQKFAQVLVGVDTGSNQGDYKSVLDYFGSWILRNLKD